MLHLVFQLTIKLFAIMCCLPLSLTGCNDDNNNNAESSKIYLTTSNASTYLSIVAKTYGTNYSGSSYKTITSTVSISGASSNFNFYDVEVTIMISGSMVLGSKNNSGTSYTQTLNCSLNIGGSGSDSTTDYVYTLYGEMTRYGANAYSVSGRGYTITSISGYVERV